MSFDVLTIMFQCLIPPKTSQLCKAQRQILGVHKRKIQLLTNIDAKR